MLPAKLVSYCRIHFRKTKKLYVEEKDLNRGEYDGSHELVVRTSARGSEMNDQWPSADRSARTLGPRAPGAALLPVPPLPETTSTGSRPAFYRTRVQECITNEYEVSWNSVLK